MRWLVVASWIGVLACGGSVPPSSQSYPFFGDPQRAGDDDPGADATVCIAPCAVGLRRCEQNAVEECRAVAGCPSWTLAQACSEVEVCVGEACVSRPCADSAVEICADVGICRNGTRECHAGSWGFCDWQIGPGLEGCDGLDNDCNGAVDDLAVTPQCPLQAGVCDQSRQRCSSESLTLICDTEAYTNHAVGNGLVYEAGEETLCDGLDNDCDGETDELRLVDAANCGSCGRSCPAVARGEVSCAGGECLVECDAGSLLCQGGCPVCPTEHVTEVGCQASACVATECALGFETCASGCCLKALAGVRITEVFVDDDGQDAVELLVLSPGELDGITLAVKNSVRYVFPNTVAKTAGEVLVFHAQDPGTDETGTDPTRSTDFESTPGFDFWDPAGADGVAITATDAELEVRWPDGTSLDYIAWCDGTFGTGQATRVGAHVAAGGWTVAGATLSVTDLVDSTLDNGSNQSFSRVDGAGPDSQAARDWTDRAITLGIVP